MATHCHARSSFAAALLALALVATPAAAQVFDTHAPRAILIDADTDTVLFQKDADSRMAPASMAKLVTSSVVFDAIRSGKLSLDTEFVVSARARKEGGAGSGGSTMFVKPGSSIRIADLIKGVVIQSGNDASIVVAEGIAGTESAFAESMNAEARRIGLAGSHFMNATGLDDPDQYTTARDLAKVAKYIIHEFPQFYPIYGEPSFTWNKITQKNRNPLLEMNIGADGLKTGFTETAGYGLVGSAVRDGVRLIMVIAGTKSDKERSEEARKLLDWGFRTFEKLQVFKEGDIVGEARVFGGTAKTVGLVSRGPVGMLLPRDAGPTMKAEIVYQGPVPAPIKAGQEIGFVRITAADGLTKEQPLYAAHAVDAGGMTSRAVDAANELLFGWW